MDRLSGGPIIRPGYLRIDGCGGVPAADLRDFLATLDDCYQAVARVELAAYELAASAEALRRHGPPRLWGISPWLSSTRALLSTEAMPAPPLAVHRVVLQSPGFWEFMGTLNPLEMLRKFLNDRHERQKDREYRNVTEQRKLEIEIALGRLEVIRKMAEIKREFGSEFAGPDIETRIWAAELAPKMEKLAAFDQRGLINGGSASTSPEPQERAEDDGSSGSKPEPA